MAFGRLERSSASPPMSEINMTPLIDVMLVLLVIFMVGAPLMVSSLQLELPASGAARPSEAPDFIVVAIDPQGRLYVGDQPVEAAPFAQQVEQLARQNPTAEVRLRADKAVPYGRVAELIGLIQQAGLTRIALVAETPGGQPAN